MKLLIIEEKKFSEAVLWSLHRRLPYLIDIDTKASIPQCVPLPLHTTE